MTAHEPYFADHFDRVARALVIFSLFALIVGIVYCGLSLFGDGSHLLLRQLTRQDFWLQNPARTLASYVTQAPVILALKFGVDDLKTLIDLFSFGLSLPLFLWAAALYIHRATFLFWPFVSAFTASFLTSGFAINGEYNLAAALSALAAAILLKTAPMTKARAIVLLLCSIGLMKSYESTLFIGPLLVLLCFVRRRERCDAPLPTVLIALAAICCLIGTIVAIHSILFPISRELLQGALSSYALKFPHFKALIVMSVLAALAVVLTGRKRAAVIGLAALLAVIYVFAPKWWAHPQEHYLNRTLSQVLLFVVLCFCASLVVVRRLGWTLPIGAAAPVILACFVAVEATFFVQLAGFRVWLGQFEREVATRSGIVPIDTTSLVPTPYFWNWANPALSAVIKGRSPGAIIDNFRDYKGWEPFPTRETPLVDYPKSSPMF